MLRFKRWILFVAAALTLVAWSLAQETGGGITGIVEFEGATVYVGPDFGYEAVAQLPKNTSVKVIGRRGFFINSWGGDDWLQIEFQGETGWVYARLIRTSILFNDIPVRGIGLPRNRDGRVPDGFDLSDNICEAWQGELVMTGDFMAGDAFVTFRYPELQGARVYTIVLDNEQGKRSTGVDSLTGEAVLYRSDLAYFQQTYTWYVAPYWTVDDNRYRWQQLCPVKRGGTFTVPGPVVTPFATRPRNFYYYRTPAPTLTPPPLIP